MMFHQHSRWSTNKTVSSTRGPAVLVSLLLLIFLLLSLSNPTIALSQELYFSGGTIPGELRCPDRTPHSTLQLSSRKPDSLMPPEYEELAKFSIHDDTSSQHIFLGEPSRADPSKPFSIGIWGDSHAAFGYFSEGIIREFGLTQVEVQPTFIPPTMDRSGVRLPIRKFCQSTGWTYEYAYTSSHISAQFAKGLANLKSETPLSYLWVDFRWHNKNPNLHALNVLYIPPVSGENTLVGISTDEGAEKIIKLDPEGNGIIAIHTEQPISIIKLRLIVGSLVLQGFVPEYVEKPKMYLDTFGVPGAKVRGWKSVSAEYLKKTSSDIIYDLVILEYGTNEGNDKNLDPEKYVAELRASLKNMRQVYPDSLCVLIGPTDRGILVKNSSRRKTSNTSSSLNELLHYAQVHKKLGTIQSAVSKEFSCNYWSWQEAMGGRGSAYMWLHHSPALMSKDLIHLSIPGYQLSARKFVADTQLNNFVPNP